MTGSSVGRYQILDTLGKGSMGIVYLAYDPQLDRQVAIKMLSAETSKDPEWRARLMREARAIAAITHPNIAPLFEVAETDGVPYLVMERVEGRSLRELLVGRPLALDRVLELGIQIADALSAAHEKGVLHRDLKPENIIVGPRLRAKVLDFGLAKRLGLFAQNPSAFRTMAGVVVGSPRYMSPEQVQGFELDHRTDLFSFGTILFEMTTGRLPFKGDSFLTTVLAIVSDPAPPVRQLNPEAPEELETIIERLLAKSPDDRIQQAEDVASALRWLKQAQQSQVNHVLAARPLAPVGAASPAEATKPPASAPSDAAAEARPAATRPSRPPLTLAVFVALLVLSALVAGYLYFAR